jgi:hypothetical protein
VGISKLLDQTPPYPSRSPRSITATYIACCVSSSILRVSAIDPACPTTSKTFSLKGGGESLSDGSVVLNEWDHFGQIRAAETLIGVGPGLCAFPRTLLLRASVNRLG